MRTHNNEFEEIAKILQMNETLSSGAFKSKKNNKENMLKFTVMELNKIERVQKYAMKN
jgi:hypothetical protein